MESVPGNAVLQCSQHCASRPTCFGFSWLQLGLCRLFNWSAFINDTWNSSDACDVYTRSEQFKQLQKRLKFVGCKQSSTHSSHICDNAIDGNRKKNLSFGSCTHTTGNPFEWWEGQLNAPSFVSYVTIYNRQDYAERLNKFSLQMDGVECNRVSLTLPFSVANFSCNAFGSRVRVTNLFGQYLSICEIEAYTL
uniref:FTP domain-containing protein n=1 Tax=Macrostomum lignano TaxID=282301 RepID=A0A1I8HCM1_9PLAT